MQQNRWTDTIEVLTIEEYLSKRERIRREEKEERETTKESRMVPLLWMSY